MKTFYQWLFIIILVIIGCDREGKVVPSVELTGSTDCKDISLKAGAAHSSDQDCIQYKWLDGDTLNIKHVNAGFNCCPQGFRVALRVSGDTLIISESENSSLCDCSCLFDLDYTLTGISRGIWYIKVVEPYVQQAGEEKILFTANFKRIVEGEYCVTRTGYPWR